MSTPLTNGTPSNNRPRWPTYNRQPRALASLRLAQVYQMCSGKNALESYRESCQRVAQGNEVFRSFGLATVVIEHMAQIDASLASDDIPPLSDAVHQCELADCQEELTDAMLRRAIEEGTLTVEQAQASIKASALKRHRAEIKERALRAWIEEQKK